MDLVELIARDYTIVGTGRFLKTAEHSSLVIDKEKQIFYWNSKKISGNVRDWFLKIKHEPFTGTVHKPSIFDTQVSDEALLSYHPDASLIDLFWKNSVNSNYWASYRGYTQETIDKFRLGYTGEWNTIPVYEDGIFVNFQCRTNEPEKRMKHWYKGVGPHTFNFSILPLVRDFVIITESPVDAIMLDQFNIPAVSQTAGSGDVKIFAKNIVKFLHIKKVFIVYDNDTAGREGASKLSTLFGEQASVFTFDGFSPKFDITDYFKQGKSTDDFCRLIGV